MSKPSSIQIPVMPRINRKPDTRTTKGALASAADSLAKSVSSKLPNVNVDEASLKTSLQAAISVAEKIQDNTPKESGFRISELEISFGITATGKVGLLGTGIDIECEASFSVTLTRS